MTCGRPARFIEDVTCGLASEKVRRTTLLGGSGAAVTCCHLAEVAAGTNPQVNLCWRQLHRPAQERRRVVTWDRLALSIETCRWRAGELSEPLGVWLVVLLGGRGGRVTITGKAPLKVTSPWWGVAPCSGTGTIGGGQRVTVASWHVTLLTLVLCGDGTAHGSAEL